MYALAFFSGSAVCPVLPLTMINYMWTAKYRGWKSTIKVENKKELHRNSKWSVQGSLHMKDVSAIHWKNENHSAVAPLFSLENDRAWRRTRACQTGRLYKLSTKGRLFGTGELILYPLKKKKKKKKSYFTFWKFDLHNADWCFFNARELGSPPTAEQPHFTLLRTFNII